LPPNPQYTGSAFTQFAGTGTRALTRPTSVAIVVVTEASWVVKRRDGAWT
jgi:hypothetical protein